jgi:hypothetical protein
MGKMKEIFDAVSNDSNLQSKFKEVIRKSEGVGQEEAERNLPGQKTQSFRKWNLTWWLEGNLI